jgi:hypothetical protein
MNLGSLGQKLGYDAGQFQIVSLDLSIETYKQFLLPSDFNYAPSFQQPELRVLMDNLFFT